MIRAVVFDWAGTLVDHGSRAPALAFVEAFERFGVEATEAEARAPMGLEKRAHLRAMLAVAPLRARWEAAQGEAAEAAFARLYEAFAPLAAEIAAREAAPVPGAPEALAALRAKGLRIGSTTGYAREIIDHVIPRAAALGVSPDVAICADEVKAPRPAPDMILAAMAALGEGDPAAVLVVDDSAPGIEAAKAAGARALGVTLSGNGAGLSADALAALGPEARAALRDRAAAPLLAAGAEAVLDSVADLPAWLEAQA